MTERKSVDEANHDQNMKVVQAWVENMKNDPKCCIEYPIGQDLDQSTSCLGSHVVLGKSPHSDEGLLMYVNVYVCFSIVLQEIHHGSFGLDLTLWYKLFSHSSTHSNHRYVPQKRWKFVNATSPKKENRVKINKSYMNLVIGATIKLNKVLGMGEKLVLVELMVREQEYLPYQTTFFTTRKRWGYLTQPKRC